jgi:hypothetical protein
MTNTIKLDQNITYLKQFPTSDIFVQYTDGSSFLYDRSFNLKRQINIMNSFSVLNSLTASDSGKYAYGILGTDRFVFYSFGTDSHITISSLNAQKLIFAYVYEGQPGDKIILIYESSIRIFYYDINSASFYN